MLHFEISRSKSVIPDSVLTTRSVLLSTLLGTTPPRMRVAALVRVGEMFAISESAVRTALNRMVARSELTTDGDGRYTLAGHLLARQRRQDASRSADRMDWSGRWRVAVVTADGRAAIDRSELRGAMAALRFGEQREGLWIRPDNLAADRLSAARAVADAQCYWYSAHPDADDRLLASALWDLHGWAARATVIRRDMAELMGRLVDVDPRALRSGFVVSAAALRHFQADPLLPNELLDRQWPGARLRADYSHYDRVYRDALAGWLA